LHNDTIKRKNLLLVEDDEVNAKIIIRFLNEEYNTEWVTSGIEAINLTAVKKYDGILMDISLKGEYDGLKATQQIRTNDAYKSVPVIAVTANAMVGDKERFLKGGCTHYISKPFTKNELLTLLRNVFEDRN